MRCISCGERLSRERLGVAGAGFAMCNACIGVFQDLAHGDFPVHLPTSRPSWGIGQLDADTIEHLTDAELRHEVAIVKELIAPFVAMIDAGERKLAGDPYWRPLDTAIHSHLQIVALPDGTLIQVASFLGNERHDSRQQQPVYGYYLDPAWSTPWPYVHIEWPDFGLPTDTAALRATSAEILAKATSGDMVEIGCIGGHGRTGTLLAILAIQAGVPADEAVAWVRTNYCISAVETVEQEQFVAAWCDS
jgi:hypothetical protein